LKLLVIFNPRALSGRAAKKLPAIRDALTDRAIEFEFLMTRGPGDATRLVAESSLDGFDAVVAAGGDGTVFEVLNGLYMHQRAQRIPLGLIPMGTGNAFAREFGLLPSHWIKAIDRLASENLRRVDVGHVSCPDESFYFLNIIGLGFAVDASLAARKLKFLGNAAYTLGTLWQTLKFNSYPLVIELDGQRIQQDNVFVEISNSRYTGTTFLMAPQARIDDGFLDVTMLRKLSRFRLFRLFPTIYSGRHVHFEEVETCQVQHIRIESPAGMLLAPDGEFRGHTPVEIRCLHRDLEFMG